MIRKAEPNDIPAIVAFLEQHIETSMFLLGNLEAHGLNNEEHPNGTTYFLRETGDGITGVFGASVGGFLMCQLPGINATEAQTYAHLLQGYILRGMTGDVDQVSTILDALPVPEESWQTRSNQPLYALDLATLATVEAEIRHPEYGDQALLAEWFQQYAEDTGLPAGSGDGSALHEARAAASIDSDEVVLLLENDKPVAMSSVNAQAGQAVQIGWLFVPRHLRGQGFGGRVVAAQLEYLRQFGITRAILFAASPDAVRAYQKIGFRRVGDYHVAHLRQPEQLGSLR